MSSSRRPLNLIAQSYRRKLTDLLDDLRGGAEPGAGSVAPRTVTTVRTVCHRCDGDGVVAHPRAAATTDGDQALGFEV